MRPTIISADEPIRIATKATARAATRIDARRQLRQSLWMMGILGVAFCAVFAARPMPSDHMRAVEVSAIR